jgi:crossover junction endodeoxyribonuclease RusA
MIQIDLPWPSRDLHPNARVHWSKRAKAAKKARADAGWAAKAAGIRPADPDIPQCLKVTAIFSPPDNRRRDIDGMLSNIKSFLDGISDVVGVDDSKWHIALRRDPPVKGGEVRIELEDASHIARAATAWRNERRIAQIDDIVANVVGDGK